MMNIPLNQIGSCRYEIPRSFKEGMRVPGRIYADEKLLKHILEDRALEQVINVAFLPGIVSRSMAMPDMHWGYGFPIGGVAATDPKDGGVISPGGVGFDINCGVRLMRSHLTVEEVRPQVKRLTELLFKNVPTGVGAKGGVPLRKGDLKQILNKGSRWAVEREYGTNGDLEATEDYGCVPDADASAVSQRAYDRGKNQLGTLGSGNHFLEIQYVDDIYDQAAAEQLNIFKGQVTVMIHCGSRGLGHQVCTDFCKIFGHCLSKYDIYLPDQQLACAPVHSPEGKEYLAAMRAAANFAFCNRQVILHNTRRSFEKVLNKSWGELGLSLVYDVAHNIAKMEKHKVDGKERVLCVHRKGATRSFPAGHPELPARFRAIGQPVIIPGDMGRHSFLLIGQEGSSETFYSCCHGAGRVMSRSKAKKTFQARDLLNELASRGIVVQAQSKATVVEEASGVYKDAREVVDVVQAAGLAGKVCRLSPLGVVKG